MNTLFDISPAERAARDGIARAERSQRDADAAWLEYAIECVRGVAMEMPEFIIDEVWARIKRLRPDKVKEGRVMGAVMRKAVKLSICLPTGRFRKSAQKQCHGNPRQIWHSLLWVAR